MHRDGQWSGIERYGVGWGGVGSEKVYWHGGGEDMHCMDILFVGFLLSDPMSVIEEANSLLNNNTDSLQTCFNLLKSVIYSVSKRSCLLERGGQKIQSFKSCSCYVSPGSMEEYMEIHQ